MTQREIALPISEEIARSLRVGDTVYVSGTVFTARDAAHVLLLKQQADGTAPVLDMSGLAVYHCGPVMRRGDTGWKVLSAGPTTSMRMEELEARFITTFHPRIIIGKGGMGQKTKSALACEGAVYAHYTGGAGALAAQAVESVGGVFFLQELGMAEAVWVFLMRRFGPLLITMDSMGEDMYADVEHVVTSNQTRIATKIKRGL